MGRRKKELTKEYFEPIDLFSEEPVIDPNSIVCHLCGKRFVPTEYHCYYVDNKLVCSWECFFKHVTVWELEKMKLKESQPKRGRKPKEIAVGGEENDEDVL